MPQIELQEDRIAIELKLLRSGQYTWTISGIKHESEKKELVDTISIIDEMLKQKFPEFTRRGSGRVASIDDDE
jgi:hypothetical protein